MHLGNGAITPECAVLTYGAAAAGLAAGAVAARRAGLTRDRLLLAAGLGGFVFAVQALNIPVLPGISGHFVGGALLAALLGPGLGAWTMAAALAIQAIILGDGGLAALGANVINMALLPAGMVAMWNLLPAHIFARNASEGFPPSILTKSSISPAALSLTAAFSVPLAAALIVVETSLFRSATELDGWTNFAALMLGAHLWIGLFEGALTAVTVAAFPRLATSNKHRFRPAMCRLGLALVLIAVALPWSSPLPDGYEAAATASGRTALLDE